MIYFIPCDYAALFRVLVSGFLKIISPFEKIPRIMTGKNYSDPSRFFMITASTTSTIPRTRTPGARTGPAGDSAGAGGSVAHGVGMVIEEFRNAGVFSGIVAFVEVVPGGGAVVPEVVTFVPGVAVVVRGAVVFTVVGEAVVVTGVGVGEIHGERGEEMDKPALKDSHFCLVFLVPVLPDQHVEGALAVGVIRERGGAHVFAVKEDRGAGRVGLEKDAVCPRGGRGCRWHGGYHRDGRVRSGGSVSRNRRRW